jgi:hypothetical protein
MECAGDARGVGYGPILGETELRKAVGVEMERMYRFKIPQTPTTSNSNTAEPSIGEEGTLAATPATSAAKDGEGPPTWQEIAITSGCNQAFFDVMMAVCERGDGVVLPVPWVSRMSVARSESEVNHRENESEWKRIGECARERKVNGELVEREREKEE